MHPCGVPSPVVAGTWTHVVSSVGASEGEHPSDAMPLELQPRDHRVIDALTRRVRVLTIEQLTRTWWGSGVGALASAKRRVSKLEAGGYLERSEAMVHPELELSEPLAVWELGGPVPPLAQVAASLERRWPLPPIRTSLVIATKQAAARFGGHGGRHPRPNELSHDVCMGALFVNRFAADEKAVEAWVSEAELKARGWGKRGGILPDAMLEPEGGPATVLEICGRYSLKRLEHFHQECHQAWLRYELW